MSLLGEVSIDLNMFNPERLEFPADTSNTWLTTCRDSDAKASMSKRALVIWAAALSASGAWTESRYRFAQALACGEEPEYDTEIMCVRPHAGKQGASSKQTESQVG